MAKYIDADKVLNNLPDDVPYKASVKRVLIQAPKEDVVEVKHGKWIIKRDEYDNEYMMCSCCKEEFYPVDEDTVDTTPNYCMNCGAKMDGGEKDEDFC